MATAASGSEGERLSLLFHAYDLDGSGRIEKDEFRAICRELQVPPQEVEGIFGRLDVDHDGTVTLDEFIAGFRGRHGEEREEEEEGAFPAAGAEEDYQVMPRGAPPGMRAAEPERLRALFRACDVDQTGRVQRDQFLSLCRQLGVSGAQEAERIFPRPDADRDAAALTLDQVLGGFRCGSSVEMEADVGVDGSVAWEDFERRLGDQAVFIPRKEQAATLYLNISLTEPRLMQQFERVIINFTKEIKQHNSEMENLALAVKRAQDQASMQLSEMEDEMDHRIQAAEKKSRQQATTTTASERRAHPRRGVAHRFTGTRVCVCTRTADTRRGKTALG
ncbi:unnamed protein product [Merluccius merluccius]